MEFTINLYNTLSNSDLAFFLKSEFNLTNEVIQADCVNDKTLFVLNTSRPNRLYNCRQLKVSDLSLLKADPP